MMPEFYDSLIFGITDVQYDYHIIADGAYPFRRWLLTPYRDNGHLNEQEKRYNRYLSSCRVVVERSFAVLKGRFRRLQCLDTCFGVLYTIYACLTMKKSRSSLITMTIESFNR